MRRIRRERLCLRCGAAQRPREGESAGVCACCGARWSMLQWIEPAEAYSARRPIPWMRMLRVAAVAVAITALLAWPLLSMARWIDVGAIAGRRVDVNRGVTAIMIYLIGLMPIAIGAGDRSCVACGHDLTRTADAAGCGTCPECGCAFARPAAPVKP
jgi:hypothetical protein